MKPLRDLVGRELEWTQPRALKREFELKDDGETVAQLHFRSSFGSFATAEAGDESWTFKRVGFWQTRVTICPAGPVPQGRRRAASLVKGGDPARGGRASRTAVAGGPRLVPRREDA